MKGSRGVSVSTDSQGTKALVTQEINMKLPRFNETSYAHFITTKTFHNKKVFKDEKCCKILLQDIDFYRKKLGFKLISYCIMPDHLHFIVWRDVENYKDLTISKIIRSIKSHSARKIVDYLYPTGGRGPLTSSKNGSGQGTRTTHYSYPKRRVSEQKYKIWQSSFYDFNLYTDKKLKEKLNYIHFNPVCGKLSNKPEDWPWSSFNYYNSGKQDNILIDAWNKI